jgi:hypothetical protein
MGYEFCRSKRRREKTSEISCYNLNEGERGVIKNAFFLKATSPQCQTALQGLV